MRAARVVREPHREALRILRGGLREARLEEGLQVRKQRQLKLPDQIGSVLAGLQNRMAKGSNFLRHLCLVLQFILAEVLPFDPHLEFVVFQIESVLLEADPAEEAESRHPLEGLILGASVLVGLSQGVAMLQGPMRVPREALEMQIQLPKRHLRLAVALQGFLELVGHVKHVQLILRRINATALSDHLLSGRSFSILTGRRLARGTRHRTGRWCRERASAIRRKILHVLIRREEAVPQHRQVRKL
mmetsp:Transcript_94949/g.272292  ORF Transcript_94949/g.272292 Transcript_94949/m.272292 type:complete len:245 (-) Transcript_94949:973-1707(-)